MVRRTILFVTALLAIMVVATAAGPIPPMRIEVYYFHPAKRTQTSLNIEKVARDAVLSQYPVRVKRGEIIFKSLDLKSEEGMERAAKFGIRKETLVVILLEDREDITKQAKKYADRQPEKLKEEVKLAVERVIKKLTDRQNAGQ